MNSSDGDDGGVQILALDGVVAQYTITDSCNIMYRNRYNGDSLLVLKGDKL